MIPLTAAELVAAIAADPKERAVLEAARPSTPAPRRKARPEKPEPPPLSKRAHLEASLPPAPPAGKLNPALVATDLVGELRGLILDAQMALRAQGRLQVMEDVYRLLLSNLVEDLSCDRFPIVRPQDVRGKSRSAEVVSVRHQAIATALLAGIPDRELLAFFSMERSSLGFIRQRAGIHRRSA